MNVREVTAKVIETPAGQFIAFQGDDGFNLIPMVKYLNFAGSLEKLLDMSPDMLAWFFERSVVNMAMGLGEALVERNKLTYGKESNPGGDAGIVERQ
jgi:hypothetical protein